MEYHQPCLGSSDFLHIFNFDGDIYDQLLLVGFVKRIRGEQKFDGPEEKKRLVEITRQSIEVGLKEVKPWNFLGDMGAAIHDFVRENGYSVVREIGGHGVGLQFHEEPWVSYVSERGTEMLMVPGMMFTIEPMVNMGKPDVFVDADDDWTVYTEDGKPSAQWEIQVLVTEDGYEIIAY